MNINRNTLPFYTRYFDGSGANNFFSVSNLAALGSSFDSQRTMINSLTTANILKVNGDDILVPLEGLLMMPALTGSNKAPLVIIAHGNANSYFLDDDVTVRTTPVPSYEGYQVLQNELKERGIASYSINLNIVNAMHSNDDHYCRIFLMFSHLLLLKELAGDTTSIPGTDPSPHYFLDGAGTITAASAITNSATPGSNTRLQALKTLRDQVTNKIDFSKVGFMGHSRGASAVARLYEYLFNGTAAGTASAQFNVNSVLNTRIQQLVAYNNNFSRESVKAIFSLQPEETACILQSTSTMFFVVAGSHDEDVSGRAASIYESVSAPKSMMFVHGATHKRFNSVWRLGASRTDEINMMVSGDSTIRVLSNRQHDTISRVVFSSFFRATLKNETNQFAYFYRNIRYPISVDIERAWQFPYPFPAAASNLVSFDNGLKNTPILHPTGGTPPNTTLPFQESESASSTLQTLANEFIFGDPLHNRDFTNQHFSAFLYRKQPNSNTASMVISMNQNLSTFTHFSFRFAKWYLIYSSTPSIMPTRPIVTDVPSRVDLRNFTLQLFENDTPLGVKLIGSRMSNIIHRSYPTLKYSPGGDDAQGYYWASDILLQTVEVEISSFRIPSAADLARVNKIKIEFTPERYISNSGKDMFVFNDFILTNRTIPTPVIP